MPEASIPYNIVQHKHPPHYLYQRQKETVIHVPSLSKISSKTPSGKNMTCFDVSKFNTRETENYCLQPSSSSTSTVGASKDRKKERGV